MNLLKSVLSLFLLTLLTACGGGGGGAGTPILGGSGSATVSDVVVVLSSQTIASSGLETVTATITTLDANRAAVGNVPVTVSIDSNGIVTPSATSTDASGTLTATVSIGADRSARRLTVTATSGALSRTASLNVVGSDATASDLVLVLSSLTISNTGSQTVAATATALDAKRNALQGVPVTISVNSNAVVTPVGPLTDASGVLRATVGIGSDRSNRTITVTATSGTLVRQTTLVVSEGAVGVAVAADLSLTLSSASLNNGGTNTITATATAVDANRNVVSGIPITFKVDASAVVAVSGATTNAAGAVVATVGIGADRSNRLVTVTATSGALTKTASFRVIGADLGATFASLVDTGSRANRVEYRLVDTNTLPMVGETIVVSAPGLPTSSGVTDINGKFAYIYDAPTVTGVLALTASAAGDTEITSITVQTAGGGVIAPAIGPVLGASLASNPSVVTVNAIGSNSNQVELRALFVGPNNAPIPRVRARFDLDGNGNSTDGVVSWLGGSYAYADVNGVARATFTPGQRSSPTNGVALRVCYDLVDFPVTSCPNATRATLTVALEALSVNIRTNELIKEGSAKLTYIKEFVVMVVDSAGQAKADVLITPSVDLLGYSKGRYEWNGKAWEQKPSLVSSESYSWNAALRRWESGAPGSTAMCPNEDANRNGNREAADFAPGSAPLPLANRGEDLNWNGELDPRKADVAIKIVGSPKTDANGLAIVQIEYGKSVASWVSFRITVTASGVSGSEARAYFTGVLPYAADAVTNENVPPAFVISPYGRSTVCTDDK